MRKYVVVKPMFSLLGLMVTPNYVKHIYWKSNRQIADLIITEDLEEAMILELDEIGYCRWVDNMAQIPRGFKLKELKERR